MYKIYFDNRVIKILAKNELSNLNDEHVLFCKSKKSFDNAYHLFLIDLSISEIFITCNNPEKIFKYLKSKFSPIKAAGGIVINKSGKLLVIKRNGFWDLPKGKIEKTEGKKIAGLREVEEECGISGMEIESKAEKTYHTYKFKGKYLFKTTYWYVMRYNGDEELLPQIEEGITEVKWINKVDINSILDETFESLKELFLLAKDA